MLYLVAILLPPLAVVLAGKPQKLVTNTLLTLLMWLPGIVHAWVTINRAKQERRDKRLVAALGREMARQQTMLPH